MAISRIGVTSINGATVAALPSHQAGDVLVALVYRAGSNAQAGNGGWTIPAASIGGGNTNAAQIAYKVATSSSESIPTFTSATQVIIASYRGVDNTTPFGGILNTGSALGNDFQYGALTMTVATGTSWVVGGVGTRTGNLASAVGVAPTGMTNVTTVVDPGGGLLGSAGFHDTNAGVTAWSLVTVAQGNSGHRVITAELIAAAATGGGIPVLSHHYRMMRQRVFVPKRRRLIIPGIQMMRAA